MWLIKPLFLSFFFSLFLTKGVVAQSSSFYFDKIVFKGNSHFSDSELKKLVENYLSQPVDISDLARITNSITDWLVEQGYVTSGAYLPEQELSDGILVIQIVEGRIDEVKVDGVSSGLQGYAQDRLAPYLEVPLNLDALETGLNVLLEDRRFSSVNAELAEGEGRDSFLYLLLEEAPTWNLSLEFGNTGTKISDERDQNRGTIALRNHNLTGVGDEWIFSYEESGVSDFFQTRYSVPLGGQHRLFAEYRNNEFVSNLDFVEVALFSDTVSVGYEWEAMNRVTEELTFGVKFDWINSETFLDGERFPFNLGTFESDGQTRLRVLRLEGRYLQRNDRSIFLARSRVSWGLDWFDATNNKIGIDGQFISVLGELQYIIKVNDDWRLLGRGLVQLSPDAILPVEQFSIGGINSVRGFTAAARSGDTGIFTSLQGEWDATENLTVQLFWDWGMVGNNEIALDGINRDVTTPSILSSIGVGVNYSLLESVVLRGSLAIPITSESEEISQPFLVELHYQLQF